MTLDPREQFAATTTALLDRHPTLALVYAEISGQFFGAAAARHPDRVVNVGIREQQLIATGAGMGLTGLRPIIHTFASFLVERPFEQIKLDLNHQDVGAVLISTGGSVDVSAGGRTHQSPADVALIDTLPGWTVWTPGHAEEVAHAVETAATATGRHYIRVVGQTNADPHPVTPGRFEVVQRGSAGTVLAVGPMLDPVLAAAVGLDLTVLYAGAVRPFDSATVRAELAGGLLVVVEPYLVGTSAHPASRALADRPHRLISAGIGREELRRYGTPEEHLAAHGLDVSGLRATLESALTGKTVALH